MLSGAAFLGVSYHYMVKYMNVRFPSLLPLEGISLCLIFLLQHVPVHENSPLGLMGRMRERLDEVWRMGKRDALRRDAVARLKEVERGARVQMSRIQRVGYFVVPPVGFVLGSYVALWLLHRQIENLHEDNKFFYLKKQEEEAARRAQLPPLEKDSRK